MTIQEKELLKNVLSFKIQKQVYGPKEIPKWEGFSMLKLQARKNIKE
jgi:hypothetical protein